MSLVNRASSVYIILVVTLMSCLSLSSFSARADNTCWASGQGVFSFGTVSAGASATTSMNVTATCQGSYGKSVWFRVCLQPATEILTMNTNTSPAYSFKFQVFTASDMTRALDTSNAAELTMIAGDNESVSGQFRLVGRTMSGQTGLPAQEYFNYYFPLTMKWTSAEREEMLPACQVGTMVAPYPASATATVKNTCAISGVSVLNFGSLMGGQTPQLRGTAQNSISIQCPVGTAYSVGLGDGQHFNGSQRQLCSVEGECVTYGIWKDAAATKAWGNVPGATALDVSSSSGESSRYVVYGVLPAQPWPSPGTYTDTVIITLWY